MRRFAVDGGKEIFQIPVGDYVASSPAVQGSMAFVGTFGNEVIGVDWKEGKVVWRYQHPKRHFPFYSSPAVAGDVVVIGGRDKILHALDKSTGKPKWLYTAKARIESSPVIAGNQVLAVPKNGEIIILDLQNGEVLWSYETGSTIVSSPALIEGMFFIGDDDGRFHGFGK